VIAFDRIPHEHAELLAQIGCLQPEWVASNKAGANIGESREKVPDHRSDVMRNVIARSFAKYSFNHHIGF